MLSLACRHQLCISVTSGHELATLLGQLGYPKWWPDLIMNLWGPCFSKAVTRVLGNDQLIGHWEPMYHLNVRWIHPFFLLHQWASSSRLQKSVVSMFIPFFTCRSKEPQMIKRYPKLQAFIIISVWCIYLGVCMCACEGTCVWICLCGYQSAFSTDSCLILFFPFETGSLTEPGAYWLATHDWSIGISYRNNKIKFILCPVPHKMVCVLKTRFHRGWTSGDREDRTLFFIRGIQTILMQVIQSHILQLKVCFAYISLLIEPNKNRFCIIQEVDGF